MGAKIVRVLLGLGLLVITASQVSAGEIDILVDKLVEKGILTSVEARVILEETREQVAKEKAEQQAAKEQQMAKEVPQDKSYAVPDWVSKIRLVGDLRLRYQHDKKDNDSNSRNRGRVRYRLGVIANVTETVEVGAGLASGGSDPRSTNQTFQDTFSSKGINLDYAYAQWKAAEGLKIIAGKFKRKPYLWIPTDLLWDGDVNPEGFSFHYENLLLDNTDYWLAGGIWILDENGKVKNADPFMKYIQGGLKFKEGMTDGKLAVTFYDPQAVEDITLDNSSGTNTTAANGLQSSYTSIAIGGEIGFKELFGGELPFNLDERIAFFGEFVKNLDDNNVINDNLAGHSFGFKFGHKKVKKQGSWQFKYIKAKLGKDAWLDTFPDSDRFGGDTGIESHETSMKYAIKKNIIAGIDYYHSWSDSDRSNKEDLVQADLLFKF